MEYGDPRCICYGRAVLRDARIRCKADSWHVRTVCLVNMICAIIRPFQACILIFVGVLIPARAYRELAAIVSVALHTLLVFLNKNEIR
jgi:hypothetical protein